jgi:hypothetical protein
MGVMLQAPSTNTIIDTMLTNSEHKSNLMYAGNFSRIAPSVRSLVVGNNYFAEFSQPGFVEFIKAADWRDAGQDAALNFLEQDLGEVLGGFLGPGNWRPQRKAIAGYLLGRPVEADKH